MKKIRIDDVGHFYLDEFDIGPFVISYKIKSKERVEVVLQGKIILPPEKIDPEEDEETNDER